MADIPVTGTNIVGHTLLSPYLLVIIHHPRQSDRICLSVEFQIHAAIRHILLYAVQLP